MAERASPVRSGRRARRSSRRSLEPLCDAVGDPQGIGDDGERGVHGTDRGKETGVGKIEIVELVRLAVEIEHGCGWIGPEACGTGLVCRASERDILAEIQ